MSERVDSIRIDRIVEWLTDGARSAPTPQELLDELGNRFLEAGVALSEIAIFVASLHPQISGRRFVWRRGAGVTITSLSYEDALAGVYPVGPVAKVIKSGEALRRSFTSPPDGSDSPELDYPRLEEVAAGGASDYLATPLHFSYGEVHAAEWVTDREGGFLREELAALDRVLGPFCRMAEIWALRRTARNLLDTYVGHRTGERILSGDIHRGHSESIYAVIWLSDLRSFTARSDRLAADKLVTLLNHYFDTQVPAIEAHGGEILKFMGDGLLALFPVEKGEDPSAPCRRALAAALEVSDQVDAMSAREVAAGREEVRFGVGLHLGELQWGNVGGGSRLDFTCIGPAVNVAARLEELAGQLDQTIVISAEVASRVDTPVHSLGEHPLRGFSRALEVFAVDKTDGSSDTESRTR